MPANSDHAMCDILAIRLARVCAFVVIFWLAGSPSLLATGNCPPNANRGMISLVRDVEGNSQSRQKKMPTHLLRRKMMSLFLTPAERINMLGGLMPLHRHRALMIFGIEGLAFLWALTRLSRRQVPPVNLLRYLHEFLN